MSGTELGTTELKFGTGEIRFYWDAVNERLDIIDAADNVLVRIDPAGVTSFPGGVAAFDLDAPGAIGGTTPAAITGTTVTATTGLAVSRAGETTAGLTVTNSTGAMTFESNGDVLIVKTPGSGTGMYANAAAWYMQRIFRADTNNARDLGTSTVGWRNLFLAGDAYIGGGDIYGPTDGNLTISSDADLILRLDADNDGTASLLVKNGEGTTVATVTETGALSVVDVTTTGDVTVGDDLSVAGRVATSTVTTFTADDATPSVAAGNIFVTATSGSAVTITGLDDAAEGQHIYILPTASPVTTFDADAAENMAADWLSSDGEPLHLLYANSQLWEIN